jgi:hypothetical protein
MSQKIFPLWYRAYFIVPLLGVLYVVIPLFVWDFSPHALTHTTPDFLLGATDWGTGNIYSFTKIGYWIGIILGTIANIRITPKIHSMATSLFWRFRLNAWHIGAAFIIPLLSSIGGISIDSLDMWLLFGYLFICTSFILIMIAIAQAQRLPRSIYATVLFAGSLAWVFVPVSYGRP